MHRTSSQQLWLHLLRQGDSLGRSLREGRYGSMPDPIVHILVHQSPGLLGKGARGAEDIKSLVLAGGSLDVEAGPKLRAPPSKEEEEADDERYGDSSKGDHRKGDAGFALVSEVGGTVVTMEVGPVLVIVVIIGVPVQHAA